VLSSGGFFGCLWLPSLTVVGLRFSRSYTLPALYYSYTSSQLKNELWLEPFKLPLSLFLKKLPLSTLRWNRPKGKRCMERELFLCLYTYSLNQSCDQRAWGSKICPASDTYPTLRSRGNICSWRRGGGGQLRMCWYNPWENNIEFWCDRFFFLQQPCEDTTLLSSDLCHCQWEICCQSTCSSIDSSFFNLKIYIFLQGCTQKKIWLYNRHNGKNKKLSSVGKDLGKILISHW